MGVAVIDTGFWKIDSLEKDTGGNGRVASQYDAINNVVVSNWSAVSTDTTGHGTHVTSLIASSRKNASNNYFGVAPDARIISIKAFGEDGSSQLRHGDPRDRLGGHQQEPRSRSVFSICR